MRPSHCMTVFLLATVAATGLCESDRSATSSSAANAAESPPYKTIHKTDRYEEREYEGGDYVNNNVTGSFTIAYTKGLSQLYAYFLGRNEDNVRMSRTEPVFTKLYPDEDFSSTKDEYTISLYLPSEYQGKGPKPIVDDLEIVHVPRTRAYVREFSGFATEGKVLDEAVRLRSDLLEDEIRDFDDSELWLMVYDPPTKITHRRNEVSFVAKHKQHGDNPFLLVPDNIVAKLRSAYGTLFG